jgi:hypothetical protein
LTSGKGNLISRAERVLQLGAKASKRLPLNLVATASGDEEIGTTEPLDKLTQTLGLDESGLFPDLVAVEAEEAEDDSLPLLNSKSAGVGET